MTFASGPSKILTVNEEVTYGTLVAAGGQSLERVGSTVDITKAVYGSAAIRTDQQIAISRHGLRTIGGNIKGELNPASYKRLMQAVVRQDFVAGATTGSGVIYSTVSGTSFVRSSGSFLTNGFKIGSVIQSSGFTTTATNLRRFLATSVSATVLGVVNMDGTAATLATEAAGATVTIAEVGKVAFVPATAQTDKSFSIEHWYSDIAQSEAFIGCKPTAMDIALPTTGLCTIDFPILGKDILRSVTQQLTSPAAPGTGAGLASVNGVLLVQGAPVGVLNSLSFKLDGKHQGGSVVGSNTTPFVWAGPVEGTGQIVAFFQDATFRDYFVDEVDPVSIVAVMTTSNVPAPDFLAFTMPRAKVNGATKDDKQTGGLMLTGAISFLRNTAGGAGTSSENTTLRIQDSLA
jgi:hypothetical protein